MASTSLIRSRLVAPLSTATRSTARYNPIPLVLSQRRGLSRLPQGKQANNPLEDPQEDMGGPGGQELYPVSMALHKRFASITAAGVMTACAIMYIAKRLEWRHDPNIVHVLVHDNTKGELDDVKRIPVRVRGEDA